MQFTNARASRQAVDYYELFRLPSDAPFRDIEAAYWGLAKDRHARDDIALLNEAYEVLSHKDRRAEYDAKRREERRQQGEQDEIVVPGKAALTGKLWQFVG